jgi:hypothetical protein
MKVEKKSELIGRGGVYRRPVLVSQKLGGYTVQAPNLHSPTSFSLVSVQPDVEFV